MTVSNLIAGFLAFTLLGLFAYGTGEVLGRAIERLLREDR